jgi:hypothetical protein
MTLAEARRLGISRQAARGHRPKEKAYTEGRIERGLYKPSPGRLTDTDRRFLRRQDYRAGPRPQDRLRFYKAREFFRGLTREERDDIMRRTARLSRGRARAVQRSRRMGRRAATGGYSGGGQFVSLEYDYTEDLDEGMEEYPDEDDPMAVLLMYGPAGAME